MHRRMTVCRSPPAMAIAVVLAISGGCATTTFSQTPSPSVAAPRYLGSVGSSGCAPPATFHAWPAPDGIPETWLDFPKGSMWVLFFNPVPPPAHKDIKVVWRMTGSAAFKFVISDQQ